MTAEVCLVCNEPLGEPNLAECSNCFRTFHLRVRMDVEGKDCGDAWLHPERLHLVFGCRACIEAGRFGQRGEGEA
jgi:hypothetical protein